MEFTFGPRHRVVTRTRRMSFARAILTVLLCAALGVWITLASMGVAHADTSGLRDGASNQTYELRAAAERLNSECRDNPRAVAACAARDGVLAQLRTSGTCWNAKAATPAALWVRCAPVQVTARNNGVPLCDKVADIAWTLAAYRDTGIVPQIAYRRAVDMANASGVDAGPLQAMTWSIYAERSHVQPSTISYTARANCLRAGGAL